MNQILIVFVCLVLNGLLAAAEMAFVSVGKAQLRILASRGLRNATILLKLKSNPERILSVIQIGITMVGAIAAAVSGAGAEESLAPILMAQFGLKESTAEALCIVGIVIPLTYMNVVFGELIPKTISLKRPTRVALAAAPWLLGADKALSPIITLLEKSTKLFLRAFGTQQEQPMVIQDDFVEIGQLGPNVRQYVLNTISAERKRASDVMIPWQEVRAVDINIPIEQVESIAIQSGHTRLPVVSDGSVVGLINTKEVMSLVRSGESDWQRHKRPILRFRGGEPILNILQKMQDGNSHIAAIYDRMDVAGIITLEDIIEEIVGDLYDEDDDGKVRRFVGRIRR